MRAEKREKRTGPPSIRKEEKTQVGLKGGAVKKVGKRGEKMAYSPGKHHRDVGALEGWAGGAGPPLLFTPLLKEEERHEEEEG